MKNIIELQFDKSISRLAGNDYGQEVYNNQVKDKIKFECNNIIVIPNCIEDIAISFVQGFIMQILNHISKDEFFDYISIKANDKVKN
ncbi:hypothetical protein Z965_02400 [Clostridium novyi A str. BKT29909]|uniref:hypothetical protein n=1 Tax=Clostridium novyi TaxID=1542 RepID=UPI0004D9E58A|nr:hypothetical protein [Clostridium novyi]KEH89613.1 hypothetical protein Z965_02400 [Clostridium novyi A str. BKT29909]